MKSKMMFGALLLSVALCSQGFGMGPCGACWSAARPAAAAEACLRQCCCRPTPVRDLFCGPERPVRVQGMLQVRDLRPGQVLLPGTRLLRPAC